MMKMVFGRPVGVELIAVLVAANGVASMLEAVAIADLTVTGVLGAAVAALIGFALIHRAYSLWNLKPGAWLITLILLSIRFVLGLFQLFIMPFSIAAGISLGLAFIAILYLIQPSIRDLFSDSRSGI